MPFEEERRVAKKEKRSSTWIHLGSFSWRVVEMVPGLEHVESETFGPSGGSGRGGRAPAPPEPPLPSVRNTVLIFLP